MWPVMEGKMSRKVAFSRASHDLAGGSYKSFHTVSEGAFSEVRVATAQNVSSIFYQGFAPV
jgi:hypothetical protein